MNGSIQSPDICRLAVIGGDMTDDFVKIFFQCFLQEATVSSSSMGRDVHSSMLSIQHSSANHNIAHPPRCPEGWFWRFCHGVWHAKIIQVSISWQLLEVVPVDPQGSWSHSAPSHWSCAPSRRCGEVSSGTWFQKPGSFLQSARSFTAIEEDGGDKRLVQLELACKAEGVAQSDPV